MTDKRQIIEDARNRGMQYCVHFTNAKNLPNILKYGILSKDDLENREIEYCYNDSFRLDGLEDAVSVSVSFPNYKMFYPLHCNDSNNEWVVLLLDAEKVLKLNCAFCYTNAANAAISSLPLEERMSLSAFEAMFAEKQEGYTRRDMELAANEPTDPQAEILVFDPIPVTAIIGAMFKDCFAMNKYMQLLQNTGIDFKVDKEYYYARHDYKYW
ncbi:MAG: DUF4433 domain-containing protein [Lachnospiraceae bacterium]|nr:DUF4433 domain-containing protein [Lachnospiraceae bacterium]